MTSISLDYLHPLVIIIRLLSLLNNSSGFLYYVSVAGVTGTKAPVKQIVANEINRIKGHTDLPVCVGFGIKTPEDAKAISLQLMEL